MPKKPETKEPSLGEDLKELEAIAAWFDRQEEIDIEEGMTKVKTAAEIILRSKRRLAGVENEFKELKAQLEQEISPDESE